MTDPSAFRRRLRPLGHYLIGFAILMKGVAKLGHAEGGLPYAILFLAAGLGVILMTALHRRLGLSGHHFEAVLYTVEALVGATLAWYFHHEGKTYLPWVTLAAAVACGALAIVMARRAGRAPAGH